VSEHLTDLEAARLLRKHPRTIQRWCQAGKLPGAYKAGRSWRIPPPALRQAGLPSGRKPEEDYVLELRKATAVVGEIAAELEELRQLGLDEEPRRRRDWRRVAQQLARLEQALEGLPELAAKVPERLLDDLARGRSPGRGGRGQARRFAT